MENQRDFILSAIQDAQSTIRAIDIKMGFLFVVIFYPVLSLQKVMESVQKLVKGNDIYLITSILILLLWILSFYTLFKSITSISNPNNTIKGNAPDSKYHNGGLYDFCFLDNFFNYPIKTNVDFYEHVHNYPKDEPSLNAQLIFEQMKLSYIRDIKIKRSSLCLKLTFSWIVFGLISWVFLFLEVGFK